MGMLSRRRTFLVDSRFQLKYTAVIVLVGVAVSALLGYFIYRLTLENTKILMLDPELQEKVSMFDRTVIFYIIGFVVLMALSLFIWGIFITHRVAGPIFIISRFLRQIADNQVPPTRQLRKGDELQELFDNFTAMVDSLKRQRCDECETLTQWAAKLRELGNEKASIMATELEQLVDKKKIWVKSS
jgi:nitrogen fixation/metabolism regulation signal transduction histidine kinase